MRESLTATAGYRVEGSSSMQEFCEEILGNRGGDRGAVGSHDLLHEVRPRLQALVRDRRPDERHLKRRREHVELPEREPAGVDLRLARRLPELAVLVQA